MSAWHEFPVTSSDQFKLSIDSWILATYSGKTEIWQFSKNCQICSVGSLRLPSTTLRDRRSGTTAQGPTLRDRRSAQLSAPLT